MTERLYFRQLLSGRDFARTDMFAQQMRNFAYLIGDRETGDTVVVDPAYAANDLVAVGLVAQGEDGTRWGARHGRGRRPDGYRGAREHDGGRRQPVGSTLDDAWNCGQTDTR